MRIAIVQFPGSNCERETALAVKRAGMEPVEFLWNEAHTTLRNMAGYIIVGGFSYEDRSRAGIIAALDPVISEIKIQSEQGKPVLGICNGAQILVEAGLVPGLENNKIGMALTANKRVTQEGNILGTGFYNAWVHVRLSDEYQRNAFTQYLTLGDILPVPVAHGEGRFVMTPALLQEIEQQGLNIFQYCDTVGTIHAHFPINPNGSLGNIAAVSNKVGNVLAMMPHPERTTHGDAIFQSMRDYIHDGHWQQTPPLSYYPRRITPLTYQKPAQARECIVELLITDNHALTVQNTLNQLGFPVSVKRYTHWEIQGDDSNATTANNTTVSPPTHHHSLSSLYEQIKQTGVLYNAQKEVEKKPMTTWQSPITKTCLVRAKEDLLGQQKLQLLTKHFAIQHIQSIRHGVLWQFSSHHMDIAACMNDILQTNIIFNPYGHDYYSYHVD
jgi:phosphoribosylformylglycinamidine synthase I